MTVHDRMPKLRESFRKKHISLTPNKDLEL